MNKINIKRVVERHKRMLEYQDEIYPFTPSVKELMEVWELRTTSAVHLTLCHLVEMGLCVKRGDGNARSVHALEA